MKRIPAIEITIKPDAWDRHRPGSFKWIRTAGADQSIIGMQYLCPCGCGTIIVTTTEVYRCNSSSRSDA